MERNTCVRRGLMSCYFAGPGNAEGFIVIPVATILITRLYLKLTGYPQVGSGNLHIAYTVDGELLMMLALLTGWLALGVGARRLAVVALRPLQLLRSAALLFTLLSTMVHFATEGFAALITLSIGLFAMAVLSDQLTMRERAELSADAAHPLAGSPTSGPAGKL